MGLPTTTLELNFKKGIQTKTDEKLPSVDGELRQLSNGVLNKIGKINKRNGFAALSNLFNGGSLSSGAGMANINEELNLFDGSYLYGFSDASSTWIRKGKARSIIATNHEIVQNNDQQTTPDIAYAGSVECHLREDSRGGIYYSLIDSSSRTVIVPDTQLTSVGSVPKIFSLNNYFIAIYANTSNQLRYHTLSVASASSGFGNAATFASNLHGTNLAFDGVVAGNKLFIAYNTNAASIRVKPIDQNLVLGSETNQASITADSTISTFTDATQNIWVVAATATVVKAFILSYTAATVLANTTIETVNDVYRITGIVSGTTATLYYEVNASQTYNQLIRSVTLTTSGSVGTPAVFRRSVGLAGKCFSTSSATFLPVAHQSSLQSTFFLLDSSGSVVAKMLPGNGGGLANKRVLPNVVEQGTGTGIFLFPNTVKSPVRSDSGIFYSNLGINLSVLDFSHHNSFLNASIGENLLVVGGILSSFDGAAIVEHNYHLFPENFTAATSITGPGVIGDGYYFYKCVYNWYDNNGNPHRSAPSVALQVHNVGNDTITLTVPTLRLTEKNRVVVEAYRTQNNGTVYYKVTSTALPTYNDPTSDTVTITDILNDTDITANEPLYTAGEVENNAPPACSLISLWKTRAWIAGLEDPYRLQFTKKNVVGFPPNFNSTFTIDLSPHGGKIVDLAVLGSLLIIFKERAIYALSGEGPNNAGAQNDYQQPQLISSDIGALCAGTVCQIPQGLVFVSPRGIHLLDHSGTISYLGNAVEDFFDNLTFVSAITVPLQTKVIFATQEGTWLVYDYFMEQWSTWNSLPAEDLILWNDVPVFVKADGAVLEQDSGFLDNGLPVSYEIGTSWFVPAGQQGYCQLHTITLLGDFKSAHKLQIDFYRDWRETKRTYVIDVEQTLTHSNYGSGTYGHGPFGGVTPRYQFTLKINQKLSSFRLVISDLTSTGESFSLSGLRAEIAGLPESNRLPAKNKRA